MKLQRAGEPGETEVEILSRTGDEIRARIGGRELVAQFESDLRGGGILAIDGLRFPVFGARRKDSTIVAVGPASFEFKPVDEGRRRHALGLAAPEVTAPMPGKVMKVLVKDGDVVAAGDPLAVLEAMKMETTLSAESAAVVKRVLVAEGQMVDHGAVLIELSPPPASSTPQSAPPAP